MLTLAFNEDDDIDRRILEALEKIQKQQAEQKRRLDRRRLEALEKIQKQQAEQKRRLDRRRPRGPSPIYAW
ncbi:hypothetical protein QE152_g26365 [Popillia japonica]|uniref:Uncharacterized protein n=1 Tax=Popillia japonica TaxID=7064 RepID=A0AAW1JXJ0_POPJA